MVYVATLYFFTVNPHTKKYNKCMYDGSYTQRVQKIPDFNFILIFHSIHIHIYSIIIASTVHVCNIIIQISPIWQPYMEEKTFIDSLHVCTHSTQLHIASYIAIAIHRDRHITHTCIQLCYTLDPSIQLVSCIM